MHYYNLRCCNVGHQCKKLIFEVFPFALISVDDYALKNQKLVDIEIIVERFFSESPPRMLIHPKYGLKNFEVKHLVEKRLIKRNTRQGRLYNNLLV